MGVVEGIGTVNSGRGTDGGTLDHNRHAHERRTIFAPHGSADPLLLCICRKHGKQSHDSKQDSFH